MDWNTIDWPTVLTMLIASATPIAAIVGFGLRRIDKKFDAMDKRLNVQSARSDKLYEMFIDLVKETRAG